MKRFTTTWVLTLTVVLFAIAAHAAARMPGFFNDNMVLQRDREVPVWGWADKGETVTPAVKLFDGWGRVHIDENGFIYAVISECAGNDCRQMESPA